MTKLEAWKKWCESFGMDGTEYTLEKSSHGMVFSYAWDAAVKAEREACAKACEIRRYVFDDYEEARYYNQAIEKCAAAIRARGEQEQPR